MASDPQRLLWLGQVFSEPIVLASPAISPAANGWQSGLLSALSGTGCEIRILGHQPEPLWPRGRIRMPGSDGVAPLRAISPVPQTWVRYWNLPRLREPLLARRYVRTFSEILREGFRPDCVLGYNVYAHSLAVAREAKRAGIPWVPVIADAPGEPAAYARLERQLASAAGCVFLSWHSYSRWQGTPRLHLDGGVTTVPEREPDLPNEAKPKVVFYSGVLNQYGGVELLLDAFALIRDPGVRLWVCGIGDNLKLRQAVQRDSRITFFGCVPEEKLHELARQAWITVNPRPSAIPDNAHNFPSKLLEYLSYGKPVVSTWSPGLAPEYRPLVDVPRDESPAGLADAIQRTLALPLVERLAIQSQARRFLEENRNWRNQARRLLSFLGTLWN